MAEVGGLCEWGLRCQGRRNGERTHSKASETLVLRGRLEAVAGFLLKCKRWLRSFLTISACYSCPMMSSKTLRMQERDTFRMYRGSLGLLGTHADLNAGEMVLPMMMTQDDQVQDQKAAELGTLCKALWHGYIDCEFQSVYPE